ncbi:MAG: hypothetical protein LBN34_08870 [Clostridiales Family XIII bacterium]|nr:hypothetical protein [Clostridiales Family XIII bacterium]
MKTNTNRTLGHKRWLAVFLTVVMTLGVILPQFAMATDNNLEENTNGGG